MFSSRIIIRLSDIPLTSTIRRYFASQGRITTRKPRIRGPVASIIDRLSDAGDRFDQRQRQSPEKNKIYDQSNYKDQYPKKRKSRRSSVSEIDQLGRSSDQIGSLSEKSSFNHEKWTVENLDPASVDLTRLQRLIAHRRYLIVQPIDDQKYQVQYSTDFIDFLILWCNAKCEEIDQGHLDPIEAALCIANVMHSMKITLKELKKKKPPRGRCLAEMSRLYSLGLQKLGERSENVEADPSTVNRILCQYAEACCNFDFDPSKSDIDLWPYWYRIAQFYFEEVETDANWQSEREDWRKKQDFVEVNDQFLWCEAN